MSSLAAIVEEKDDSQAILAPIYPDEFPQTKQADRGRPDTYTPEIASEVCERIAKGESIKHICQELDLNRQLLNRWRQKYHGFRDAYACAREAQLEHWSDDMLDIAEEATRADPKHTGRVQAHKLEIETRQWIMSRLRPNQWGDFRKVENVGAQVAVQVNVNGPSQMDYTQWCAAMSQEGKPVDVSVENERENK